jgi:hypothetical protein
MRRFSGHETFAIREGWLYKGVSTLIADPNLFEGPHPADRLGVGSNMGKSIKHWLSACGLADYQEPEKGSKKRKLVINDFGRLVYEQDPYFNQLGTWAMIHANLVASGESTAAWDWFFNTSAESVFDRHTLTDQFHRWARANAPRQPSEVTIKKDLSCLLATYSLRVPQDVLDPEEAMDCPMWDLGLVTYYKGAATFKTNRMPKKLPGEVIGYCLSLCREEGQVGKKAALMEFEQAAIAEKGPGRAFFLSPSALYETIEAAISQNPNCGLAVESQAGLRMIRFDNKTPIEWAKHYYGV